MRKTKGVRRQASGEAAGKSFRLTPYAYRLTAPGWIP